MAEPYLTDLRALLDRLAPLATIEEALVCKHFFSGAAAYAAGRIFLTLTPVGLAVKLPAARRDALLAAGGRPLRYFPKAPVKKGYVLLSEKMVKKDQVLASLIAESVRFCLAAGARSG